MQQQFHSMNRLHYPVVLVAGILLLATSSFAHSPSSPHSVVDKVDKATTKERLLSKAGAIDFRYDKLVQHYIESYTVRARPRAARIINRAQIYFPIIEKYLQKDSLPDELKYLAVMESAVDPNAVSDAGAVGIWQLMPATARNFGLIVNSQVDERRDIHKSTQAALGYLKHLRKKLGSWTLAVAGYNCGGGNVSKAIRFSYSTDFWELRMFLPKQTQLYVHRMAAAVYVMNYHFLHNLHPATKEYHLQFTKATKVYHQMNFNQIAEAIDVPIKTLQRLNPSYRTEIIPDSQKGNYLVLPKVKVGTFTTYYNFMVAQKPEEYI